ncbi:hypothetical protein [Streptosporangium sp. NBC_01756]|uniref:hypothetical protein n=1 Tax=Streptosporangium sp. NBC_01756 TaxID=2975950 RepID=UPI002DDC50AF|nr:hypothetical protein [Streptosporangium sp. NBC_01756]WSC85797.1 hypothetical protein OIE48_36420 [Streptosporangium sp. NBC_01756]
MDDATAESMKNQHLITINQDPLGLRAVRIGDDGTRRLPARRPNHGDRLRIAFTGRNCRCRAQ